MATEGTVITKEMQSRSDVELKSLLAEKREELQGASFKHALGQLTNTSLLGSLKRDIARLSTILRQRALKAEA
jgi:large subunit ribosomal protein L29